MFIHPVPPKKKPKLYEKKTPPKTEFEAAR
jgi:hypothetical protein